MPRRLADLLAIVVVIAGLAAPARSDVLRVCADPNNLPFSNAERQGFENKLAELIA
jgi:mxaJ protein